MDPFPAPEQAIGLSRQEAADVQQLQELAQAAVQPWIFAVAVLAITAVAAALLIVGKAQPPPQVDTAEVLVPLQPGPGRDQPGR